MDLIIPDQMKALDAIRLLFPESSRRTLQHWIKGGRFLLNGQAIERENMIVEKGQVVQLVADYHPKRAANVKIIYEERYFIVIDKPSGLLSVPLDIPSTKHSALGILREYYQTDQIFAVHRIDRETSGVMLFARGFEAEKRFDKLFEQHDLEREYFAILENQLPENRGRWECTLRECTNYDVEIVHDPEEGKQAITHFEVLRRSAKYSYVRLSLETGRKHQIRVHCKQAGCPILGDGRYGSQENPIRRLCLHARLIAFVHPFTNQKHRFTSPLPFSFKKLGATDQLFSDPKTF
jgi:tRNA pseudouridine32 synthase/23S rRNA pseudouridine746 synthase/23S rRNA pseudouridine1911/1915/1917 synthase